MSELQTTTGGNAGFAGCFACVLGSVLHSSSATPEYDFSVYIPHTIDEIPFIPQQSVECDLQLANNITLVKPTHLCRPSFIGKQKVQRLRTTTTTNKHDGATEGTRLHCHQHVMH